MGWTQKLVELHHRETLVVIFFFVLLLSEAALEYVRLQTLAQFRLFLFPSVNQIERPLNTPDGQALARRYVRVDPSCRESYIVPGNVERRGLER